MVVRHPINTLFCAGCFLFAAGLFFHRCHPRDLTWDQIEIYHEGNRVRGFDLRIKPGHQPDIQQLSLNLRGQRQKVLGEWIVVESGRIGFRSVVPLTPGNTYEIRLGDQVVDELSLPSPEMAPPYVTSLFPSTDTLPENLLKIYLNFSRSMRAGEAMDHLVIVDLSTRDTLSGVFLDLQPELWNRNNTRLTLWLDPGRIKRGLIPNQEQGPPLEQGHRYRLIVLADWKDQMGTSLSREYIKDFVVNIRDDKKPDPKDWKVNIPDSPASSLIVLFKKPLDAVLIVETLSIWQDTQSIPGRFIIGENEASIQFMPHANWSPGTYTLRIESRLEDLAGNNLNRLFDREMSEEVRMEVDYFTLNFTLSDW